MDHGLEGRKILEKEAWGLFPDDASRARILCSTQYHSRKAEDLPIGLNGVDESLLHLIRDADKLDIIEELIKSAESPNDSMIRAMLPDIKPCLELTTGVIEAANRGETLHLKDLSSLSDVMVMVAAWLKEFNYSPARRIAASRAFDKRLKSYLPSGQTTENFFKSISKSLAHPGRAYKL